MPYGKTEKEIKERKTLAIILDEYRICTICFEGLVAWVIETITMTRQGKLRTTKRPMSPSHPGGNPRGTADALNVNFPKLKVNAKK